MQNVTTIGLIGCGAWGGNILRDLIRLGCRVMVVDIDGNARSKASAAGASGVFGGVQDLPACDGYVVAVPIPDLVTETAALLRFQKPVFSEKTLCRSLDDIAILEGLNGSRYVFAMHKWHYHSGIEALRQAVVSGRIGDLEEVAATRHAWMRDWHGGDVFWTLAVHDLTIVKHILGYIPEEKDAVRIRFDADGLQIGLTAMLGGSPAVCLSVSGRHCEKRSGVQIQGTAGSAELHNAYDDHITIRDDRGEEQVAIDTTFPLYLELQEFVRYLHGGPRPRCGLDAAAEVTKAILNLKGESALSMTNRRSSRNQRLT